MASTPRIFETCFCVLFLTFKVVYCDWASSVSYEGDVGFVSAILNISYRDPETHVLRSQTGDVAKYGEGTVGPVTGVLISVKSKHGDRTSCSLPLVNSIHNVPLPSEPWIALIKRGQCNFDVKVENAYKSNASGVIVYNDRDGPDLEKMKLETRNLSAVFTYKWKGEEMLDLLLKDLPVTVEISIGRNGPRATTSLNRKPLLPRFVICEPTMPTSHCVHLTSVLFVSISFIVLMIISLAWLIFYYVQRFRYIHAKDRLSRRLCSAAKKALSKIPTKTIKSGDKEVHGDGECCAVCIEPYKTSEVLRILPCKHEFHRSCIDPWLLEHRTCPMCKMDILKHYGFVGDCCPRGHGGNLHTMHFTGSQESILHMDIEEIVAMDQGELVPRLNQNSTPMHHEQVSRALSPIVLSHSSRSSSPQDMMCADQCYLPSTSQDSNLPRENLCSRTLSDAAGSICGSSTLSTDCDNNHNSQQLSINIHDETDSTPVHLAKVESDEKPT